MNKVVETLLNHRSIRKYKQDPIPREHLNHIIQAAQAAPSSINGQQVTIINVEDKEKKRQLSEIAGGQTWVDEAPTFLIFCADFYRAKLALEAKGVEMKITDNLEAIMVGTMDAGLAMGNAIAAAESLGLGIVPIGGIRRDPEKVVELLDLPEYVFPIAGLTVGYPADPSAKKPRLPKEAVYHEETYNKDLDSLIETYNKTISDYMVKRTVGKESRDWAEGLAPIYNHIYFPKVSPTIKKQGFKNL